METINRIVESLILLEINRGADFSGAVRDALFRFKGGDLAESIGQLVQLQAEIAAAHDAATNLALDVDDTAALMLD